MALDLLQKNGIEYQMRLLPNESTDDDEEENPQNINITEEEKTKIILIDNLISNLSKNKYRYTYTKEFKEFAYTLYCTSSGCYRILRQAFPFPSESSLRKYFRPFVNEIENRLTDINSVKNTLLKRQDLQKAKSFDTIICVLAVDAFSISILMPKNKENKDLTNSFLYLIIPLDVRIRPFPVFIERKPSGNATDDTIKAINNIIRQSKDTKFKIKFVSVDGDKKYEDCFGSTLIVIQSLITKFLMIESLKVSEFISKFELNEIIIYISDTLHLLKNFRSKLLKGFVLLNLISVSDNLISATKIESILKLDSNQF